MERIVGIDFGTSTTYMNVKRYQGDQPDGDKFSYIPVMFNYGESSGYVATIEKHPYRRRIYHHRPGTSAYQG